MSEVGRGALKKRIKPLPVDWTDLKKGEEKGGQKGGDTFSRVPLRDREKRQ